MKKFAVLMVCSLSLSVWSLAAPAKPAAKTTGINCPACSKIGMKMPMTAKKTKTNTRAVKVNGKTMYCCTKCNMKTMTTKAPAKKAPVKKS